MGAAPPPAAPPKLTGTGRAPPLEEAFPPLALPEAPPEGWVEGTPPSGSASLGASRAV
jgi:hypothetical protein